MANMSTFGARCMAVGISSPYAQVIDALRLAPEEETDVTEVSMVRIQVACTWVTHGDGDRAFLWWGRRNAGYANVTMEDETNHVEGGLLGHRQATMSLDRWRFWLGRFKELGKESSGVSDKLRRATLAAAGNMKLAEAGKLNQPAENKDPEGGTGEGTAGQNEVGEEGGTVVGDEQ